MAEGQPTDMAVCSECKKEGAERTRQKKGTGARRNKVMVSLEIAAADGHVKCLQALLNAGADVNYANKKNGYTPLMWDAQNGRDECVEMLIKAGADVNTTKLISPLMLASGSKGNARCVELLLEAGADVNYNDGDDGYTALMHAAGSGRADAATLLIKAGADVNKVDESETISAIICSAGSKEGWKCIEVLAKAGADVNFVSDYKTPLMCAAEEDCCKTAEALIKAGSDAKTTNSDGSNILHWATGWSKAMYKIFIDAGVDVNARASSGDETPLMRCLEYSDLECAELLIEAGADVNFTSNRPKHPPTPLFLAYKTNSVNLLLRSGTRINIRNTEGLNALERKLSRTVRTRRRKVEEFCLVLFAAGETVNEVTPPVWFYNHMIIVSKSRTKVIRTGHSSGSGVEATPIEKKSSCFLM